MGLRLRTPPGVPKLLRTQNRSKPARTRIRFRTARLSDDPLGDDNIDQPSRTHEHRARGLARPTHKDEPGQVGQHLGARSKADRIRPNHPFAVLADVAASYHRIDATDDRRHHQSAKDQSFDVDANAIARGPCVKLGHPESAQRSDQTTDAEHSAGPSMPRAMAAANPGGELKRPDNAVRN